MRGYVRFISAVMAFIMLSTGAVVSRAASVDFSDVTGHWAETTLRQAYNDGIIVGDKNSLLPDANISAAQILTMICRVLGAEKPADISGWGLPEGAWYYEYVAKAAYLGLVSSADTKDVLAPISRQNAFYLLAEAFQLTEVKPDTSVLDKFTDSRLITDSRRPALASLFSQGLIVGHGGRLHVNRYATRAEVLSLLYRIAGEHLPASGVVGDYKHGVVLQGSAALSGNSFDGGLWLNCAASEISLNFVKADRVGIRSHTLELLEIGGSSHIKNLTLASQSGNITVAPDNDAVVESLIVGTGSGQVTVSGVDVIEVSGNNRRVVITGDAEKIIVSGRNNTIQVRKDVQIGRIELLRTALDNRVNLDGNVDELELIGLRAAVVGSGYAGSVILSRDHARVDVDYGQLHDIIDNGIIGASVKISLPKRLPVGDTLHAAALIENAAQGKKCSLTWYVDNVPVGETMIETGTEPPELSHKFVYSRNMQERANIRVSIKYVTMQDERQEISAESTVILENYSKQHWMQLDAPRVLNKVTTDYKGDFTLKWALQNDLDSYEKEVWVDAKGYTSKSDYLVWVSIAYQRVNIFKYSAAGNWELIRTCIVGTGAMNSQTKRGVTTVTYKQFYGWTTRAYTVKPVVRFWPRSGYAFHSRIYYPNTSTLRDESIGFPVSLGCIRMYDEDIWYLYDNIPDGSTVVVY